MLFFPAFFHLIQSFIWHHYSSFGIIFFSVTVGMVSTMLAYNVTSTWPKKSTPGWLSSGTAASPRWNSFMDISITPGPCLHVCYSEIRCNFPLKYSLWPTNFLRMLSIHHRVCCRPFRAMGLLPDTWDSGLRMRRECRERFPLHRELAILTSITAREWRTCRDACRDRLLAVSLDVGGGENAPGIPGWAIEDQTKIMNSFLWSASIQPTPPTADMASHVALAIYIYN